MSSISGRQKQNLTQVLATFLQGDEEWLFEQQLQTVQLVVLTDLSQSNQQLIQDFCCYWKFIW